ncbi:MAG TPA: pilus assembly protein [Burkholderiaceae bacterium]|nr:pilus assembly protein [Burkholderiaceae bacterium]
MKQLTVLFSAVVAIAMLAGCVATTPQVDGKHGAAVTLTRAQQTLNPDASRNNNPVKGLDGKAAKGALDNYRDSFRVPPSEAANVINIGVGQGSSR